MPSCGSAGDAVTMAKIVFFVFLDAAPQVTEKRSFSVTC